MSAGGNPEQVTVQKESAGGWDIVNFDLFKRPPETLAALVYAIGFVLIFAALIMAGMGLLVAFRIGYESTTGDFRDRIEASKVFLPILVALIGGPLLIWRVITAHIQALAARQQAQTARESHYTDLFTKAVEQLGATRETKRYMIADKGEAIGNRELVNQTEPNLEVRLGAIYALERIAYDSERDHWPIMEVLCAYVRQNSGKSAPCPVPLGDIFREDIPAVFFSKLMTGEGRSAVYEWLGTLSKLRPDVQAAITVIGRRRAERRAWEKERANVEKTSIEIDTAYRLDLRDADLNQVNLVGNFERADFRGASLNGAIIQNAHLDGALFQETSLIGARVYESSFVGASFNHARMELADVMSCDLRKSKFVRTRAESSDFGGTDLGRADFAFSMLQDSQFIEASLIETQFESSNLQEANFWWARLEGARLSKTKVDGASFQDVSLFRADLSTIEGLSAEQLEEAEGGDITTKLPEGIVRPSHWEFHQLTDEEIRLRIKERDHLINQAIMGASNN